jgi:hypothetical protein
MKRWIVALAVVLCACQQKPATGAAKTETAREKNTAEKAFDAGQNARKNAEKIKAEQEKKAKEAIEQTNE